MVRHLAIVVLLLAVLVTVPFSSASTDSIEVACADAHVWPSSAIQPDLLGLVCTVYDGAETVGSVGVNVLFEQNSDTEEHESPIQKSGLPEETRQQLLLLLILWSQE